MADSPKPRSLPLVLVAGALTLVVTVVRLVGERQGWDPTWFSSAPGSPLNPFGIVWLVPLFGFAFGRRLAAGGRPAFVASFFVPMFGLMALLGTGLFVFHEYEGQALRDALGYVVYAGPALALLALFAWPRAFFANLGYALLARAPVALVQYFDVQHGWQTHYGKVHEKLAPLLADDANARILALSVAQAAFWVPFTLLLGGGCAALGAATVRKD